MGNIRYKGFELPHRYGWVSPEGEFFGCEYMEHISCADAIAKSRYPDEVRRVPNPEEILEKHGFVKITRSLSGRWRVEVIPGKLRDDHSEVVTGKQAEKIRELGFAEELDYLEPMILAD